MSLVVPQEQNPSREILPDYNRPITAEDKAWFIPLGCSWPASDQEFSWLQEINDLMRIGSIRVTTGFTEPERQQVAEARDRFFSLFPKIISAVETIKNDGRHDLIVPVDTFVGAQRILYENGIDTAKPIVAHYVLLGMSWWEAKHKLDSLNALGLKLPKVINRMPSLLIYNPGTIKAKLEDLSDMGLDVPRIVNTDAKILGLDTKIIQDRIGYLDRKGLDGIALVNAIPSIADLTSESVDEKINNLDKLDLDYKKIIKGHPSTLTSSPNRITKNVRTLRAIGRLWGLSQTEVTTLIEAYPTILGYRRERIKTIARIANQTLSHRFPVTKNDLHSTGMAGLEEMVVAYLERKQEITEPKHIRTASLRCKKLGKKVLKGIIAQHPEDPVAKSYLKAYGSKAA